MRLSRQSRIVAALVALISILFTQLAVASYVCPSMQIAHAMESVAAVDHHDMSGCEGLETAAPPLLCHEHGQTGNQSLAKAELPNVAPFVATMLVQTVATTNQPCRSAVPPTAALFLTRITAPPLSIRNCCFRI